ncbi:M48 family metalloprotease [Mesobacillus maritimus]|uniref:M48 family metalloprotease n=1 Tax=Mesobacillus maritimus TaxID=1643336 RepID=A0ABS7K4T5_9BACI|nr:M48 family metalloprotease [Mesobacillus maritimus]MBY0097269.1 M48 family metalloprotease [Mesobacillus maritimus]
MAVCICLSFLYPLNVDATEKSSVKIELHVTGETNFVVYRVPDEVIETSQQDLKSELIQSISRMWNVKNERSESYHGGIKYTIFLNDFFTSKQKTNLSFDMDPGLLTEPFHPNQTIQFDLISNKLIEWDVNNASIFSIGFTKEFSPLSEQKYMYSGTVDSFNSFENQSYLGAMNTQKVISHTIIYYSFTIMVIFCGFIMAQRFKYHVLKHPHKKNELRKIGQKFQVPVLITIMIQFLFTMTTGTIIVYEYFYGLSLGILLSFAPLLISAFSMIIFFVRTQQKIVVELEGDENTHKSSKELWSNFVPFVVPLTLTIFLNFLLYIFPWGLFNSDSSMMNLTIVHLIELVIISLAFLSAPLFYNLLLPKKVLSEELLKEKINKLCAQHQVKFNKIYIIPSREYRMANAMVSGYFNKNLYIYDYLLDQLDDDELEAVILHEIGHVKKRHLTKNFGVILAILIVFQMVFYFIPTLGWYGLLIYFSTLSLIVTAVMRRFEFQADEFAVKHMNNTNKMIDALKKITTANYMESKEGKYSRILKTHPSVEQRISNLKS